MFAIAFGTILTTMIGLALMIRLHNQGYSVWVRLYVAVTCGGLMAMTYSVTTDNRPIGYWPEALVALSAALAVIVAFVRSYQGDLPRERAGVFRSLF